MSTAKERRPLFVGGSLTVRSSMTVTGAVTASTKTVLTGGYRQPITSGSTAASFGPRGVVNVAAPAADKTFVIADMSAAGDHLTVVVDTASTKVVSLVTASSAKTFVGSTNNKMALTTGQGCAVVHFIATSTAKWAFEVNSLSTAARASLSAST